MVDQFSISSIDEIFKKDLERHWKKICLYFSLYMVSLLAGALVFFYIEQCYDPQHEVLKPFEIHYKKICGTLLRYPQVNNNSSTNNTTKLFGNSSEKSYQNIPLDLRNKSLLLYSQKLVSDFEKVQNICRTNKKKIAILQCTLNQESFLHWMDYSATIGYTIGNIFILDVR